MYERLRTEFLAKLSIDYGKKDMQRITFILDELMKDYDVTVKCTELAPINDTGPKELKIYLASKRLEGLSDNSLKGYAMIIKMFFDQVRKVPQEITANDIRMYLATYQMQRGVSDRTLSKYQDILNTFFSWLYDEEYITKNPCKTIKPIKYEAVPREGLSRYKLEELRRMITDVRERAMLDVLFSTGCRISELLNMKLGDIDPQTRSVHIIGKGRKHNTVFLNDNAIISIKAWLKVRKGDSEYLFVRVRKPYTQMKLRDAEVLFKKYEKELGVKLSPHIIRHTTASLSLEAGAQITDVQEMLGHAQLSTTQIYTHISNQNLMEAHRKYVV
jgi:integrase/recombinase XerD